jgi:hypothetical protein
VIIGSRPLVSLTSTINDWFIKVVALATFGQEKFTNHADVDMLLTQVESMPCVWLIQTLLHLLSAEF